MVITYCGLGAIFYIYCSLGAGHDGWYGESSSCSQRDHVMDRYGGHDWLDYTALFSCCSQRNFYVTVTA